MQVVDGGLIGYRDAWQLQREIHARVLDGGEETVLLVEHPPVITFGRRAEREGRTNLVASQTLLDSLGVETVESDRGGDVTFHGPGQIVAYPIIRLADHRLSVGAFVHKLEDVLIATLKKFGIATQKDAGAIGVWTRDGDGELSKIAALGVRIRRGISMHGVALNVETDLSYFDLIVPCGLSERQVTSMRAILGEKSPAIEQVKNELARQMQDLFAR